MALQGCDQGSCDGAPHFKKVDYRMCYCNVASKDCLDNSTCADYHSSKIADSGTAVFPFYLHSTVKPDDSCDFHRVWGQCLCSDGASSPGCDPTDSDSWFEQGSSVLKLPAGLFLTCSTAIPEPPTPPSHPPTAPSPPPGAPPPSPGGADSSIITEGAQARTMTGWSRTPSLPSRLPNIAPPGCGTIAVIVMCTVAGAGLLAALVFISVRRCCPPGKRADTQHSSTPYQAMPPTGQELLDSFHRQSSMLSPPHKRHSSRWRRLRSSMSHFWPSSWRGGAGQKGGGSSSSSSRDRRGSGGGRYGAGSGGEEQHLAGEGEGQGEGEDEVFTLDDLDRGQSSAHMHQQPGQHTSDSHPSRPRVAGFYSQAGGTGTGAPLSRVEVEMGPRSTAAGSGGLHSGGVGRGGSVGGGGPGGRAQQQERGPLDTKAFVLTEDDEDLEVFDPPSPQRTGNDHKRFM
ncbi:MAG: hypothetical protein WDW36_002134 [Sanguina aurantia]